MHLHDHFQDTWQFTLNDSAHGGELVLEVARLAQDLMTGCYVGTNTRCARAKRTNSNFNNSQFKLILSYDLCWFDPVQQK